jgi:hypothetical protein
MSESLVGFRVAATRQNAGALRAGCPPPSGGVKAPAATDWAVVIVAFGNATDDRFSHEVRAATG